MRSERQGRRAGLRLGGAVAVVLALVPAGGCASGSSGGPSGSSAPVHRSDPEPSELGVASSGPVTGADREVPVARSSTGLPDELVGSWSGDDAHGLGSWTIEFGSDGSYREFNARRGLGSEGRAAVVGRRLFLQPDGADARVVTWSVSGGRLSLDGLPGGTVAMYSRIG